MVEVAQYLKNLNSQRFIGQKMAMFGDSIVRYDGRAQPDGTIAVGYESWLKNLLEFAEVTNYGLSGSPFAVGVPERDSIADFIEQHYSPTDLVLIAAGTNDYRLDVPLGDILHVRSQFNRTQTTGALQSAIERILTINQEQQIVLMTPLQRDRVGYDIYSKNKAGYRLDDYRKRIIQLANLYALPVWDGYTQSGINMLNIKSYTLDGLHPNNAGYQRASLSLARYMIGMP
ncbi:SGNH/GDSL hydrolase family protein [Lapidilactobacillus bayanensis]|uniref:SGNH/GDSL hydrolase family protein n=1 Tax=Lapidilactobacillus bayanensis TaxID=2485998 RepID=UPI000F7A6BEC|nr:SGNH/GDSL hydrolase family protein [Lapidilactobacillus bayanensis]